MNLTITLSNLFFNQISSVTKGINGCIKISISLKIQPETSLTSLIDDLSAEKRIVLDSSRYQSQ